MPVIVAAIPIWNEDADTLARARRSVEGVAKVIGYDGGVTGLVLGGKWPTQAAMRDHGRELAVRAGAEWLLQLDADERLEHGRLLPAILEAWPDRAYPLPLLQEDGSLLLAPFKLVRTAGLRIVACAEYMSWYGGPVYCLAGYQAPERLRDVLLELPHLVHEPSRRPVLRRDTRLSEGERFLEPRPAAVPWELPDISLRRTATMETDPSVTEYTAEDGAFYCPGCGRRSDTPGICEGAPTAPHEPIKVESVADAAAAESGETDESAAAAPEPQSEPTAAPETAAAPEPAAAEPAAAEGTVPASETPAWPE